MCLLLMKIHFKHDRELNAITQMKTKIALWMLSKLESKQKRAL